MNKNLDNNFNTTIVAQASPSGTGGIGIIRISGINAKANVLKILDTKENMLKHAQMVLTRVKTKSISDEAMVVYFKSPKSYTGEDVVEIQCHANDLIINEIINALIINGCVLAKNGEFTKRAFLNGRIDLSAAESVIDLINAQSQAQVNMAFNTIKGETYKIIEKIEGELLQICTNISVCIDYPEEDIFLQTKDNIKSKISDIANRLEKLINNYENKRLIKEGVRVTIAGEPNVGKSTLLNKLIGFDRAIVTSNEGTTRDTIEESFLYEGIRFIFIDTAGIRNASDEAEIMGVKRSQAAIESADILLNVMDCQTKNDIFIDKVKAKNVIRVYNKVDVLNSESDNINCEPSSEENIIYISAKSGYNIDKLKAMMKGLVNSKSIFTGGEALNNLRQQNAAVNAHLALEQALQNIDNFDIDFILSDINQARRQLGEINGKNATSEVIDEIFSRFCVGK